MRVVLKCLLLLGFCATFSSGCAQEKPASESGSNPFVKDEGEQTIPLSDLIETKPEDLGFAEVGHQYLPKLTAAELMDCSINNFLNARVIQVNPDFFEGDAEALMADTVLLDGVFRNALIESGFDTEEKRQSIYGETTLAKLVVTNSGAAESEILSAKQKVEPSCDAAAGEAFSKYESAEAAEALK